LQIMSRGGKSDRERGGGKSSMPVSRARHSDPKLRAKHEMKLPSFGNFEPGFHRPRVEAERTIEAGGAKSSWGAL
jgi:hypothetical protein